MRKIILTVVLVVLLGLLSIAAPVNAAPIGTPAAAPASFPVCGNDLGLWQPTRCNGLQVEFDIQKVTLNGVDKSVTLQGAICNYQQNQANAYIQLPAQVTYYAWPTLSQSLGQAPPLDQTITLPYTWCNNFTGAISVPTSITDLGVAYQIGKNTVTWHLQV